MYISSVLNDKLVISKLDELQIGVRGNAKFVEPLKVWHSTDARRTSAVLLFSKQVSKALLGPHKDYHCP